MKSLYTIDINADVGEGVGNESTLMPYLSSCNIACGGHAGDNESMRTVVRLAKKNGVKIGAHPSFPDRENFGREIIEMPCANLYTSLKKQIRSLQLILKEENAVLHHIKPHGALYNLAAIDKKIANVIIEVIKSIALPIKLYVPFGSVISDLAIAENIQITYEAFADRNYNEDGTLVSRKKPKALITDSSELIDHVMHIIMCEKVKTISGVEVSLKAETFCVHGDNLEAVNLVSKLHKKLLKNNIIIQ